VKKIWVICAFLIVPFAKPVYGQADNKPRYNDRGYNSDPGATYGSSPSKSKKRNFKNTGMSKQLDQKVEEYYVRMEENSKRYKKMDKEMRKPQYSDPTYFGHKHPPKKRPPGKKKFCKVCGMVH
jgi:hypothetical protein